MALPTPSREPAHEPQGDLDDRDRAARTATAGSCGLHALSHAPGGRAVVALHDAPWLEVRRSPRSAAPSIAACLALSASSIWTVRRGGTEHVDLATSPLPLSRRVAASTSSPSTASTSCKTVSRDPSAPTGLRRSRRSAPQSRVAVDHRSHPTRQRACRQHGLGFSAGSVVVVMDRTSRQGGQSS